MHLMRLVVGVCFITCNLHTIDMQTLHSFQLHIMHTVHFAYSSTTNLLTLGPTVFACTYEWPCYQGLTYYFILSEEFKSYYGFVRGKQIFNLMDFSITLFLVQ